MVRSVKTFLDTYLAKLSMYLVVALALFILFGVAFTYSLLGSISFHPADITICLTVFMGVSFGASYVFGYLFGVSAHHKSAFITGGILFCIFSPVATVSNLLIYGIIAVVAIASKYILVWRGRHIFNPAAIAAVIVSLLGVQVASWWMADAIFAIPVTLLAFVILYKTERLQFAGVFLAIYIISLTIVTLMNGQPLANIVGGLVASWWPLFFVGFMLSEPQTLPPRRWQCIVIATLVGVLIPLHISLGHILVTPEIALIIGNIVACIVARRTGIILTLVKRKQFQGGQELFEFAPKRPLHFKAGQYLEVTLPHAKADLRGERRMFTIASAPESKTVKIVTRYAEQSSTFKNKLRALKPGQTLSATSVRGDFLLPKDPGNKLLFVAGGIGITPFHSFLESLQKQATSGDIILLYAVRAQDEVLFKDTFLRNKNIKTIIVAPNATGGAGTIRAQGIDAKVLREAVKDITERDVYISGSPQMVTAVAAISKKLGALTIKKDSFTGY